MTQNLAPIVADVDVLVVGGATGAVAAAAAAAQTGAEVFLAVAETYLGEDLCATGRLWSEIVQYQERADLPVLYKKLFAQKTVRPLHVKKVLDDVLLDSQVQFLFECQPVDVLRNEQGELAGVLFGTRSGLLAVRAKVIIDASVHALTAQFSGVQLRHHFQPTAFHHVMLSKNGASFDPELAVQPISSLTVQEETGDIKLDAHDFQYVISVTDYTASTMAEIRQNICDRTWSPDQAWCSERLFYVPRENIVSRCDTIEVWPGSLNLDLDALRPAEDRLYILSLYADVSRIAAEKLIEAANFIQLGERTGKQAAEDARERQIGEKVEPAHISKTELAFSMRETLRTVRFDDKPMLEIAARNLPVIAEYDVVVVGGGTGGAPAGIAAARHGARTLVLERLSALGGVGTLGMISVYYHGFREGFTAEVDAGIAHIAPNSGLDSRRWNPEHKQEWFRRELRKAKADVWFHSIVTGALTEENRVCGVIVATPYGCGLIRAAVVLDCSGNADVAAAAGAECTTTGAGHIAVQGSGLGSRHPVPSYTNTDWTFIDDSDPVDMWRAFVVARRKFHLKWDLQQLVDTRERRQICGEYTLTPVDAFAQRQFPDSICLSRSNFDTHGMTIHPLFLLEPPDRESIDVFMPLRCLLPKGVKGIAVTGLAISAHRDVMPVVRMQADIQNHSYAIGLAAVEAARNNGDFHACDLPALQQKLNTIGMLPENGITAQDNFPLPEKSLQVAIEHKLQMHQDLAVLFSNSTSAIPLVCAAYEQEVQPELRLKYAKFLAIHGNSSGAAELLEYLRNSDWDEGWNYRGMGQFGMSLSPLDRVIVCLGLAKISDAWPMLQSKVEQLDASRELSHHRAVALYCEMLQTEAAAEPLARLLRKPDMAGYAWVNITNELVDIPESATDNSTRNNSLRELVIARALFRCGDWHGAGRQILERYAGDMRGHYARHARSVLAMA